MLRGVRRLKGCSEARSEGRGGARLDVAESARAVSYDLAFDGVKSRLRCREHVEVECVPIRNPVTGAESYPGVVLPQGIIFKRADLGATTRFRASNGIEYDHSGQYMAVGP